MLTYPVNVQPRRHKDRGMDATIVMLQLENEGFMLINAFLNAQ